MDIFNVVDFFEEDNTEAEGFLAIISEEKLGPERTAVLLYGKISFSDEYDLYGEFIKTL